MTERARSIAPRYQRIADPVVLERLRQRFRSLNPGMVLLWRLGLGRWADLWPTVGGRVLVVEHQGRSSGRRYLTPLNYTPADGSVYCIVAFGERSDWYRNVMTNPDPVVWLPDGRWRVHTVEVSDAADRIDLIRRVMIDSGFAAPAFGLHPRRMTDEAVATTTGDYRLVRFDLEQRCEDGAADLAWVWAPITAGLISLAVALLRRKAQATTTRP